MAMSEYLDEVFNSFQFNTINVINKIGAKFKLEQMMTPVVNMLGDDKGMIDVVKLEEYAMPELKKLGMVEIPAIGTRYTFKEQDFINFFNKLKEKAND